MNIDDQVLQRRDKNSFDAGFNVGVDWQRDILTELLEALKVIVPAYDEARTQQQGHDLLAQARAAIAKAEAK